MLRSHPTFIGSLILAAGFVGNLQAATNFFTLPGIRFVTGAAEAGAHAAEFDAAAMPDASVSPEPQHSPEADNRLSSADRHLNAGRDLYFIGNLAAARREFDAAVDALLNAPETLPDRRRIERKLDEISV